MPPSTVTGADVLRLMLSILLVLLAPGLAAALWDEAVHLASLDGIALPLAIGALIGAAADHFLLRRVPAIGTFEHETTHALVALLFLRRLRRFVVTRHRGGLVEHSGGFGGSLGDDAITFAPYVLPTFTVAAALVRGWIPHAWFPAYDLLVGATFGYHVWSTGRETLWAWIVRRFRDADGEECTSDLARRNRAYSVVFVATVAIAVHGALFAMLGGGFARLATWGESAWTATLAAWAAPLRCCLA